MATFKICIFKHQKRVDDKYPVSIRVYWQNKYAYIKTDYYVSEKQIDKKTFKVKDVFLLNDLNSRILQYEDIKVRKLNSRINLYSAKELADYLQQESRPGTDPGIDFLQFAQAHINRLVSRGKCSTAQPMISTIRALQDYCNGRNKIPISEITVKFLHGFETYLRGERILKRKNQHGTIVTTKSKGLSDISLADYMACLRTIFNSAIDEFNDPDKDEVRILHYPFRKYKIDKSMPSRKRNLSVAQVTEIRDSILTTVRGSLARDVFMLSFYLVGSNLVDLYQALPVQYARGRFSYHRQKTSGRRSDRAFISIKVEPEAKILFEKYRDPSGQRLFNFHRLYTTPHIFSSNINLGLKQIAKSLKSTVPVSTYYARHSWATIARNDCGVSKDDVHQALNHADDGMKVTDIYIAKDWSRIDKANRLVLDLLLVSDLL